MPFGAAAQLLRFDEPGARGEAGQDHTCARDRRARVDDASGDGALRARRRAAPAGKTSLGVAHRGRRAARAHALPRLARALLRGRRTATVTHAEDLVANQPEPRQQEDQRGDHDDQLLHDQGSLHQGGHRRGSAAGWRAERWNEQEHPAAATAERPVEPLAQRVEPGLQAPADGAGGNLELPADLRRAQALVEAEEQHLPHRLVQLQHQPGHELLRLQSLDDHVSARRRARGVVGCLGAGLTPPAPEAGAGALKRELAQHAGQPGTQGTAAPFVGRRGHPGVLGEIAGVSRLGDQGAREPVHPLGVLERLFGGDGSRSVHSPDMFPQQARVLGESSRHSFLPYT